MPTLMPADGNRCPPPTVRAEIGQRAARRRMDPLHPIARAAASSQNARGWVYPGFVFLAFLPSRKYPWTLRQSGVGWISPLLPFAPAR